jgi:hypothetical protein
VFDFDQALWRFGTSGTLIALYGAVDALSKRHSGELLKRVPAPRWLRPVIVASITAFYLLIAPAGGALLGGAGNAAGIALAGLAMLARWSTRSGSRHVRHAGMSARMLFYVALPFAVGVPWGVAALTLPACAASIACSLREERLAPVAGPTPAWRWIPGVL